MTRAAVGPGGEMPEITEEDLASAQGRVRFLVAQRLERLYGAVERRLEEDESGDRPIDPRFLELGRALQRDLSVLYRMQKPPATLDEEPDDETRVVDAGALVLQQLEALEQKLQRG